MPTLPEILNQLSFVSQEMILLGLFLTAGFILIIKDWRFLILALLIQYILGGLILSRLIRPDIAIIKVLIGAFICPILFLSARQVSIPTPSILPFNVDYRPSSRHRFINAWRRVWGNLKVILFGTYTYRQRHRSSLNDSIFRLLVVLLMILVATTLSKTLGLPGLSANITAAVYWLILAGLTILILTDEPLKVGLGLFTTFTGFDLFYSTIERSLLLIGLWSTINLLVALVIGYLIIVKGAGVEEEI